MSEQEQLFKLKERDARCQKIYDIYFSIYFSTVDFFYYPPVDKFNQGNKTFKPVEFWQQLKKKHLPDLVGIFSYAKRRNFSSSSQPETGNGCAYLACAYPKKKP